MTLGIDVSNNNGSVDWRKVSADRQEIRFAYCKATEGARFTDGLYAQNRSGCKTRGILFGAYHFARPHTDAVAQAKHFAEIARPRAGDLIPMLDLETSDGLPVADVRRWVAAFLAALDKRGIPCGVYTTPSLAELAPQTQGVAKRPLWIAHVGWGGAPRVRPPTIPSPWKHGAFWQYSWKGRVQGVRGEVDMDRVLTGHLADYKLPLL